MQAAANAKTLRVGVFGLDTSHAVAFIRALNGADQPHLTARASAAGARVVAATHRRDSTGAATSVETALRACKEHGVQIVPTVGALVAAGVDAVFVDILSDGSSRLESILAVLRAGKPVFIDKPIAASLVEVAAIYAAASSLGTPIFGASSL